MLANKIIEQFDAGLISASEARANLVQLAKQAQFSADYTDHIDSYKRWTAETTAAHDALRKGKQFSPPALNDACGATESKDDRELRKAFEYAERRRKARALAGDHTSVRDAGDTSPDMGISLGDLARDAKDPHDIRS